MNIKIDLHSLRTTTAYERWQLITLALFGVLIASIILSAYFTYVYVYRTLDDAQSIVVLSSSASINEINETAFKKASQLLATKNASSTFSSPLRVVFNYTTSSTTTSLPTVIPPSK